MVKIQRMVKRCPPIIIASRRFLNDFLAQEILTSAGNAPEGNMDPEYLNVDDGDSSSLVIPTSEPQWREVALYVFNDIIIVATHAVVRGVLNRFEMEKECGNIWKFWEDTLTWKNIRVSEIIENHRETCNSRPQAVPIISFFPWF